MATDLDLKYVISADSTKLPADMAAATKTVEANTAAMAAGVKKMEEQTQSSTNGIASAFAKMASHIAGSTASVAASTTATGEALQGGLKGAAAGVKSSLGGISGAFDLVKSNLGLLTGIMAGGAMFKEAISATNSWNGEAMKLSKQLGISTQQASVYMVAMQKLGVETDTLGTAVQKISMQLMKGGTGFKTLGIETKTASGQFRPAMDLIGDAVEKIKQIHNPILQTQAGLAAFGKSWSDIKPLMKLTGAAMDEAKAKVKALNLEVSPEQAAASKAYKDSMKEVDLATKAIAINLGQAVLPTFSKLSTSLSTITTYVVSSLKPAFELIGAAFDQIVPIFEGFAEWLKVAATLIADVFGAVAHAVFGDQVPKDIDYMASVMNGFKTFFISFKVGMLVIFEALKVAVNTLKIGFVTFAEVAGKAIRFDWAGVKAAAAKGTSDLAKEMTASMNRLVDITTKGRDEIKAVWSGLKPPAKEKRQEQEHEDPELDFGKQKKENLVKEFASELAMRKADYETKQGLAGHYVEFTKQQEMEFWQSKLKLVEKGSADYKAIEMNIAKDRIAIAKQAFDVELAGIKNSQDAFKNDTDKKLEFANEYLAKVTTAYGKESTQYLEAQKAIVDIKRQAVEQLKQIDNLRVKTQQDHDADIIAAEEEMSKLRQALGVQDNLTTLAEEQSFEDRRYAIKAKALQDALLLAKSDPDKNIVEIAKINGEIESLEVGHQAKLRTIRTAATVEQSKNVMQGMSAFQTGMAGAIKSVANGTASIGGAMKSFMMGMVDAVIGILANMAAAWATQKVLEMVMGKTAAISGVAGNAAVAGAAATASAAAIPLIGWEIAPAAGLAAFTSAMAFGAAIPAAAKGFDIPAGVNPLTQLHEKEMVLPANIAQPVREMAEGGGIGKSVELHVHATDAESVARLFKNNGRALADALKDQLRKFAQ